MLDIDSDITAKHLQAAIDRLWQVAHSKTAQLCEAFGPGEGTPVFTQQGRYVTQGWTEWTKGFQFGLGLLVGEATEDPELLETARRRTVAEMPNHVTHMGVHDHGFNIISTYGNLLRLAAERQLQADSGSCDLYRLALRASGAVQAARWSRTADAGGYIYSFNGPHSLFCDTIRSLRSLAVAHQLGQVALGEADQPISLLGRLIEHARTTARYSVYYGEGRDGYDVPGRVAHESLFNPKTGDYRCPSTQQGYSPFTTWTRGHAWILLGFTEQLEFLQSLSSEALQSWGGRVAIEEMMLRAARAVADFYCGEMPSDGIPYWDTGAPGLVRINDYQHRPADPFNDHEPVDSSAAAITCQGLLRLGRLLESIFKEPQQGRHYWQAGLTVLARLLDFPYVSKDPNHQGLLLHSVYHRPRNWDFIRPGSRVPHSESSLWGDYHLAEAALLVQRINQGKPYLTFFGPQTESAIGA